MRPRGNDIRQLHGAGVVQVLASALAFHRGMRADWRADDAQRDREEDRRHQKLAGGQGYRADPTAGTPHESGMARRRVPLSSDGFWNSMALSDLCLIYRPPDRLCSVPNL